MIKISIGNFTTFKAKHVDGITFGATAWTEADYTSTAYAIDTSFATNNSSILLNIAGTSDEVNPTANYAFAKDFAESGNEKSVSDEPLLGVDDYGSQNMEISDEAPSSIGVECTVVYRNPKPTSIFNDTTKCCLVQMDNSESTTTGVLNIGYNNIIVTHVGSLQRNSNGNMEQKIKFSCRGGTSGTAATVSQAAPTETWYKIRMGRDKVEEIRTA